jgi:CheY-like chemotaxis protein
MNTLRPDLLLVDIHLPGMDGLERRSAPSASTRLQNIVVIAMTASAREGIEQEALDAGCNGFIAKAVEPKAFGGTNPWLSSRSSNCVDRFARSRRNSVAEQPRRAGLACDAPTACWYWHCTRFHCCSGDSPFTLNRMSLWHATGDAAPSSGHLNGITAPDAKPGVGTLHSAFRCAKSTPLRSS